MEQLKVMCTDENIHEGKKSYHAELTYHEIHGLLFDRENAKGNQLVPILWLIVCLSPGTVFSNWLSYSVFLGGVAIVTVAFLRHSRKVRKIINSQIENYRIKR